MTKNMMHDAGKHNVYPKKTWYYMLQVQKHGITMVMHVKAWH